MSIAASFGRSGFARFINTTAGRITRIVGGLGLIGWGYTLLPELSGILLIAGGLIPFIAGSFHMCLISAMLGGPISGEKIAKQNSPTQHP